MANFGMISQWHRVDNAKEMVTFRDMLKKGDIVQIKHWKYFYCWAICTCDGPEPKMAHRFGSEYPLLPEELCYETGSVHEIGWDDLCRGNRKHFDSSNPNFFKFKSQMAAIHNRTCSSIRINNFRDKLAAPKPIEDIVRSALEAVDTMVNGQFGQYHSRCNNDLDFVERVRYPKDALDNRLDENGCSSWYSNRALELESFSWLLKPGDMVEFNRRNVYSHWAVAIDRPLHREMCEPLVHRFGSGDATEVVNKLIGTIMQSPIQEVINGSKFRINNSRDRIYPPKDSADIRQFAVSSVNNKALGKYNLAFNNCWHFAMQARYRLNVPKNTELLTEWYTSVEAMEPLLSAGDIIEFGENLADSPDQYQELAIYVQRIKSACNVTNEVAYTLPSKGPLGKSVVRMTGIHDFFTDVAKNKKFRINNRYDCIWKPKHQEDIVKYVLGSIDKDDPFFIICARYGKTARKEVQGIGGEVSKAFAEIKIPWYIGLTI